jgi:hypothetical protein
MSVRLASREPARVPTSSINSYHLKRPHISQNKQAVNQRSTFFIKHAVGTTARRSVAISCTFWLLSSSACFVLATCHINLKVGWLIDTIICTLKWKPFQLTNKPCCLDVVAVEIFSLLAWKIGRRSMSSCITYYGDCFCCGFASSRRGSSLKLYDLLWIVQTILNCSSHISFCFANNKRTSHY